VHSEKDANLIKNNLLPPFAIFGFQKTMAEQIDLLIKESKYRGELEKCVKTIEELNIAKNPHRFQEFSYDELKKHIREKEDAAVKQLALLTQERKELVDEFYDVAAEWRYFESIYKRALLCYTSSFYHPMSDIIALRLTHKDMLFESPEQIEMCYTLSQRQRKNLVSMQCKVPTIRYANRKLMNTMVDNNNFLDYAQSKKYKENTPTKEQA